MLLCVRNPYYTIIVVITVITVIAVIAYRVRSSTKAVGYTFYSNTLYLVHALVLCFLPALVSVVNGIFAMNEESDRKEDKDNEEDDCVTFVGQSSLAFTDETKPGGQGLYLNTTLARQGVEREPGDDEERVHQRQTAPVTVRRARTTSRS